MRDPLRLSSPRPHASDAVPATEYVAPLAMVRRLSLGPPRTTNCSRYNVVAELCFGFQLLPFSSLLQLSDFILRRLIADS